MTPEVTQLCESDVLEAIELKDLLNHFVAWLLERDSGPSGQVTFSGCSRSLWRNFDERTELRWPADVARWQAALNKRRNLGRRKVIRAGPPLFILPIHVGMRLRGPP